MFKVIALAVVFSVLALKQSEAIKCHYCLTACEVSKATDKVCGAVISNNQEAFCTTEQPKDTKTPELAIRGCKIVNKGEEPNCTAGSQCTSCKTDLCNAAPSLGSNFALITMVASIFFVLLR